MPAKPTVIPAKAGIHSSDESTAWVASGSPLSRGWRGQ